MAVTNLYSNLPGHLVEFKDGGLQLTSSTTDISSTKSLLILGTAFDGPINEPVKIDSVTVSQVFGKEVDEYGFPNGATLTKYAKQAFKNGFDDVRCMRVTGSQAYTVISGSNITGWNENQSTTYNDPSTDAVVKGNAGNTSSGYEFSFPKEKGVMIKGAGTFSNNGTNDDKIIITFQGENGVDFDEKLSLANGIGSVQDWSGFTINNDKLAPIKNIRYSITCLEFLGSDIVTDSLGNDVYKTNAGVTYLHNESDNAVLKVTDDGSGTITNLAIEDGSNNAFEVDLSYVDGSGNPITNVSLFNPAVSVNSALPTDNSALNNLYSVDASGFSLKYISGTDEFNLVENNHYTVAQDPTTGKYSFTISSAQMTQIISDMGAATTPITLTNDATIKVQYNPYYEKVVEDDITNITFNESVVNVSVIEQQLTDLQAKNIKIQGVEFKNADGTSVTITRNDNDINKSIVEGLTITNHQIDFTSIIPNIILLPDVNDNTKPAAKISAGADIIMTFMYDEPILEEIKLKIKSQFGGSIYKDGAVRVDKVNDNGNQYTEIIFTRPSAKQTSLTTNTYSYSSKYYRTVDDLILAMKNDVNNTNMYDIEIIKGDSSTQIDLLDPITSDQPLSQGGDDGVKVNNDDLFKALSGERYKQTDVNTIVYNADNEPVFTVTQDMVGFLKTQGAYQILENYNVDYIYPAGVYADSKQNINPNSDFQRELALVCAVLTYRTKMTHGFIDVKPNSNTTLVGIDNYVAGIINGHDNIYYMTDSNGNVLYDSDNKPMDIGWYTSVVVGPEPVMTSDTLGTYYGSPAIAYAALNSVIEPQSAPTNKALRNVNGIKFKFSNKQMDALCGQRMVCFRLKNEGLATASSTPYVVDGVTAGAPGCDYTRMVTVKVLTDVVDQIRQVADPFIGEQNTTEQRNALSALISKRLSKLVELGEIQSYEFEVSATIQQQLLGEASIALTIVPAMELRKITTVVALRAAE